MDLEGTICPMATPTVGRQAEIDREAARSYVEWLVERGVDGLFPCGSVGEFASLQPAQRRTLFEAVVDAAGDRPVLAGCGDTSLGAVLEHADGAAEAGADAAVVVTPYYLETTSDGLREFFETVADRSPLPVVLYAIPGLTGQELPADLVADLASHDGIVGLKDTTGDLTYCYDVVERTPDPFLVFQGATELAAASLDAGADGLVAGPANVVPDRISALVDHSQRGDADRVRELMTDVVHPIVSAIDDVPTAAAIKYLCSLAGHDLGEPLPPLPTLGADDRAALGACYERVTDVDTRAT